MTPSEGGSGNQVETGGNAGTGRSQIDGAPSELFLGISGMSCVNCSRAIEKVLAAEPGILQARVYLADDTAEIQYEPGRVSPERITQLITKAGYQARVLGAAVEDESGPAQVIFTAALAIPVFALAMLAADSWANRFSQMLLSGLILMTTGKRFFVGAVRSLRHRFYNMDVLVALGVGASWGYSTLVMMAPGLAHGTAGNGMVHFEAAAVLVLFVLLGKTLESMARARAAESLKSLTSLQQGGVRKIAPDGAEIACRPDEVAIGDCLKVLPGERFLLDGVVELGESTADESLLTGESMPVPKTIGTQIFSGAINLTGELTWRVTRSGAESTLQTLVRAVRKAQADKPRLQRFADAASDYFVPFVVGVAVVTFLAWMTATKSLHVALMHAVTVLVVACPCALGLATPMAIVVASGLAMGKGILVKKSSALEALGQVKTMLFDKTGTLTVGKPDVRQMCWLAAETPEQCGRLRSLAEKSLHPLSKALSAYLLNRGVAGGSELRNLQEKRGFGLTAVLVEGNIDLALGSQALLDDLGITVPPLPEEFAREALTPVFFAVDFQVAAMFGFADSARPEAAAMVADLHARGIDVLMVSGDRRLPARAVAETIGLVPEQVRAEVLPAQKLEVVKEFLARGDTAFVGDGINDAPALSAATVGVALSSGADAAREATDIVLVNHDLRLIPLACDLSRATLRKIKQNLLWAVVYNLIMLPLAAGAFQPFLGEAWTLSPMVAGLAMALSSISVVLNSLLLRRQFR